VAVANDPVASEPPAIDPNGDTVDIKDAIVSAVGVNYITISNVEIRYNSLMILAFEEGTGRVFAVGQIVQVNAQLNVGGSLTADEIQVAP